MKVTCIIVEQNDDCVWMSRPGYIFPSGNDTEDYYGHVTKNRINLKKATFLR